VRQIILASALGIAASAAIADELRVATWNVTNYSSGRVSEFQTALYDEFEGRSLRPDVLIGQEFLSAAGVANYLSILNSAPGSPGDWAAARFVDGPDTDSAFFFRTSKVSLATELSPDGVTVVALGGTAPNHPRNIMRYDVVIAGGTTGEARLAIYSTHMKAGTTSSDQARRLLEAQRVRDDAAALPPDWNYLIGGDFNIQTSSQSAYIELIAATDGGAGQFFDPIRTPGSWNNNGAYRIVHTQDPSGAGGMDDRHDQLLASASLVDGLGLDYIGDPAIPYSTTTWDDPNHSYRSWGNDGTSFNLSLTIAGNTMVGPVIAQALVGSAAGAGHLPVFLDLRVPPCVGDLECDGIIGIDDFTEFAGCMNGPTGYAPEPSQSCLEHFDLDGELDVDLIDYADLQVIAGR